MDVLTNNLRRRSASIGLEIEVGDQLTIQAKNGKPLVFRKITGEDIEHGSDTISGVIENVRTDYKGRKRTGDIRLSIGNTWFKLKALIKNYNIVEHIQINNI